MEISSLKALLDSISVYFELSNFDSIKSEPTLKYYEAGEEILMLLKPILDSSFGSELTIDETLKKELEELDQTVEDLKDYFGGWQPLSSKVYFIIQTELLLSQIRSASIDILQFLKSLDYDLPEGLSSASIERYAEKIKHSEYEQASSLIKDAARDQLEESVGPSSEMLARIAEILSLKSNQEILIEAVALEKLKESAERAEKMEEVEFIEQLITLVTCMHDRLIVIKQSQCSSPIPIPADFCCPLSLELMTDPVIVASGQTYERAFIRKWLDLGLTVCPKTRQTLTHTNLIPNYTVKALIANWCESNNVKLPDPLKSMMSLNQPSPLLAHAAADSQVVLKGRAANPPPMSPESSGRHMGGIPPRGERTTSPLHPRSASDSLPRKVVVGNGGQGLVDIGSRLSLVTTSDAESSTTFEDTADLDSISPRKKEQNAAAKGAEEQLIMGRSHKRAVSASSAQQPNGSFYSQGGEITGDANTVSTQLIADYSSDASGEMKSDELQHATAANLVATPPQREQPDFSSWLETRTRNHPIWRRPSDRLGPRIVSSSAAAAAETTRPDLSGIETEVKKHVYGLQSDSIDTQRAATSQIRLLARNNMENRIVIASCGAVSLLVGLLCSADTQVQENAVTALLNLSINDNNKIAIANADAIEPLIHVLESGSPEAKENSAATLFSLSVIEENKIKIGRSGAVGPLVDLLGNGTPRGKKDAATALFNLSIYHENKGRIVQAGAVKYLVDLMDPAAGMVDKAVAVLANLATIPEGRTAIGQENGISVLVEVVELGSARGKENAAAALLHLCTNSSRYCSMVLQEGAVPPLVALSQTGTPRAKEKAQALLSYFRNQRHGNAGRA